VGFQCENITALTRSPIDHVSTAVGAASSVAAEFSARADVEGTLTAFGDIEPNLNNGGGSATGR